VDIQDWGALGEVFGAVGVVVTLIYLARQIRENSRQVRVSSITSINHLINEAWDPDTAISSHQAVYNSDYIPALIVKVEKGEGLTNEELLRYTAYFRAFNRDMDNQLWQYNQGLLGENIPRSIKGAVRNFIAGNSQGLEQWDGQKYSFTDEYVSFVEEAIVDLR